MTGFKMYITTKLGNPSYTPEVSERNVVFLTYAFKLLHLM